MQKVRRLHHIFLVLCLLSLGYLAGFLSSNNAQKTDLALFWQAWDVLDKQAMRSISPEQKVEGAVAGMVAALGDPYSSYFPLSDSEIFEQDLSGSFGGIGAELTERNGLLTVVSPLSGTPSQIAGLQSGDVILAIGGKPSTDLQFSQAIAEIRGEVGSVVDLEIQRKGMAESMKISIKRELITVHSVQYTVLANGVAYLQINQFGEDTAEEVRKSLLQAKQDGIRAVLLDVRNNPGGYLQSAVEIAGYFLPEKDLPSDLSNRPVVRERDRKGEEVVHRAQSGQVWQGPVVVLQNKGSASASEILLGALTEYGRAESVGQTSFGKGSVQQLQKLSNGGSIKVTVANWFTPKGTGIDGTGLKPTVFVDLSEGEIQSGTDSQVQAALRLFP
jgi:carboxyl-terminal processing protease